MSTTPFQEPFANVAPQQAPAVVQPQAPAPPAAAPIPAPSSDNPFADVLNHVATWNNALTQNTTQTAPQTQMQAVGDVVENPTTGGGGDTGGGTGGTTGGDKGRIVGTPSMPPGTDPALWADVVRYAGSASQSGANWGALYAHPEWITEFRNWSLANDPTGGIRIEDYLQAKHPELTGIQGSIAPALFNDVDRYVQSAKAQGADYSYLYQHPDYVTNFRNWAGEDASRAGVDITDWLAHTYPTMPHDLAGRNGGRDTYMIWADSQPGAGGSGSGTPPGGTPPDTRHTGGVDPFVPPPGTTPPGTPPGTTPPGTGGGFTPHTGGVDPVLQPPPGGSGAGTPGNGTGTNGTPDDIQNLIDIFNKNFGGANNPDIEKLLSPMFGRQRQLLEQQLEASAALTPGRLQSGGFGQNEGQALSDLSGQQSGQLATALQQQHLAQMQQNTQIMQLATQAGMQKYVTDINAEVTKYGINTNADLQKYLDSQDNVIKKYGIDTNDVLDRYKAELALKGEMYSADKALNAAALNSAVAKSAAASASAAAQANAKLQYDLGMAGIGVDREKNIGQFILGLLGLGNVDINSLNQILSGLPGGNIVVKP